MKLKKYRVVVKTTYIMSWEYIAGFFDGEGCIHIREKNKYAPIVLNMTQKNKTVLRIIEKFLYNNNIQCNINTDRRGYSSITINRTKDALHFLNNIVRLLIVKREKANIVILLLEDKLNKFNCRVRLTLEQKRLLKNLLNSNLTDQQIADKVRCSRRSVYDYRLGKLKFTELEKST
jgi:intein-encoded DNA endonuclease-like protein